MTQSSVTQLLLIQRLVKLWFNDTVEKTLISDTAVCDTVVNDTVVTDTEATDTVVSDTVKKRH